MSLYGRPPSLQASFRWWELDLEQPDVSQKQAMAMDRAVGGERSGEKPNPQQASVVGCT
jgi:hypothetical protein